jgi:AcrR family transcriptional regulator
MTRGLSQYAHEKVLATAAELFAESGIDATSVDSIAAASRVSKATIYKHWVDKEALCLEVMVHVHRLDEGPPEIDSGDLKADLIAFLTYEPPRAKADIQQRLMPHMVAYAARNQDFGRAWRTRVMERARNGIKKLLRRGIERGIFPAVLDDDLGVALLLGPMMFRYIFSGQLDKQWIASGAVDAYWKAHARPQIKRPASKTRKRRAAPTRK